jgi:hypothetical protein
VRSQWRRSEMAQALRPASCEIEQDLERRNKLGAFLTEVQAEQLENEQMRPHTCEYGNPRLKINTVGGYVYFAIRTPLLL